MHKTYKIQQLSNWKKGKKKSEVVLSSKKNVFLK